MALHSTPSLAGRRLATALAMLAVVALLLCASRAAALTRGTSPQGWAFVEGGVGQGEVDDMKAELARYSLWILTAERTSGAHLSDVEVTILSDKGDKLFDTALDGPWLMVDLPLGRYEVRARAGQQTQHRITTIHPGDHHQIVFYFDVADESHPEVDDIRPASPPSAPADAPQ